MTKPIIKIHDTSTNEVIEREMNAEELAVYEANLLREATALAEAKARETAKADLLSKIGITENEAKLLLS
jgi:hypothetical protein